MLLVICPFLGTGQAVYNADISWSDLKTQKTIKNLSMSYYSFEGAGNIYDFGSLPVYIQEIELPSEVFEATVEIEILSADTLSKELVGLLTDADLVRDDFQYKLDYQGKKAYLYFLPFINGENGTIIRLKSFRILSDLVPTEQKVVYMQAQTEYTSESVLSSGSWYKMGILNSGIHKLTYDDLSQMGINASSIDINKLGIFGNYNGPLPEGNEKSRPDDLQENSIQIIGGDDGSFDQEDYILFYANAAPNWKYNLFSGRFDYQNNIYTDTTYYFITPDKGSYKKMLTDAGTTSEPVQTMTSFFDYDVHEADLESLMYSGKQWYGERFTGDTSERIFTFSFPNLKQDRAVYIGFEMVARAMISTYAEVYVNDKLVIDSTRFTRISTNSSLYASHQNRKATFIAKDETLHVKVKYYSDDPTSIAWLNYLVLNVERDLSFTGGQMKFRDPHISAFGNTTRFELSNANGNVGIWDITDSHNPVLIETDLDADLLSFTLQTDYIREFIAFDGTDYYKPVSYEPVVNQNLHGIADINFVIISPEIFLDQARRLANIHEQVDGLKTVLVTPGQIYNEFSSGSQDIAAIRDFMRMLDKTGAFGDKPGYLLFFGDASFDYKHRIHGNTNFVPTYQSDESLRHTKSYVTDDFFGLLGDSEGAYCNGQLDIGIGRFPVSNIEDATSAVDKVEHYYQKNLDVMGPWRNEFCFVADDGDRNLHLQQAKYLISIADTLHSGINVNKIFSDAYTKVTVPGGKRFPEVNKKIENQVNNGALIVNYTGHGGLIGWSEEVILDVPTIRSFDNLDNMPLFITATCEFSRFDDPEFVSAGEYVFLNKNGGAIALLTTTRLAYATANIVVNMRIYENLRKRINGELPRLGDLVRLSKSPSNENYLNFVLLGDPALRLAYPEFEVVTNSINNKSVGALADTVHALSRVMISGSITDYNGVKLNDFNGYVYPKVFDKATTYTTLGTESNSDPEEFDVMDKVLYTGKVTVVNGDFEFSFMIPKDIAYQYGFGKISYYAVDTNQFIDAWGAYESLYIGGYDESAENDYTGPAINLYLNDRSFRTGDAVNSRATLFAELSDDQGINFTGHSLGRDITLVLDENMSNTMVLNDFFKLDVDTYKRGKLSYYFDDLENGWHTLILKAWDLQNNSSSATIEFYVDQYADIHLSGVYNYPNPFYDKTSFVFKHNKSGSILDIEVNIYDINGKFVQKIVETLETSGIYGSQITWDGTDQFGSPVPSGLYTYQLSVTDYYGNNTIQRQKLIKLTY